MEGEQNIVYGIYNRFHTTCFHSILVYRQSYHILLQSITLQATQVQSPLARYYTISQILVSDDLPRREYCNYFLFVVAES